MAYGIYAKYKHCQMSLMAHRIDAKYYSWQMSQQPIVPTGIWFWCLISPLANITTAKCPYWHMLCTSNITTGKCHYSKMTLLAYGIHAKYNHCEMSQQPNIPTGLWYYWCLISPLANVTTAKCPNWHIVWMPNTTTCKSHNSQMSLLAYCMDAKYHHRQMSQQPNVTTGI